MKASSKHAMLLVGLAAGAVNGLFGTGGGMVLIPLLTKYAKLKDTAIFSTSVAIILPVCLVTLFLSADMDSITFRDVLPYLIGSAVGGILCGFTGEKIPVEWLHRILGIVMIWGGIRYLC